MQSFSGCVTWWVNFQFWDKAKNHICMVSCLSKGVFKLYLHCVPYDITIFCWLNPTIVPIYIYVPGSSKWPFQPSIQGHLFAQKRSQFTTSNRSLWRTWHKSHQYPMKISHQYPINIPLKYPIKISHKYIIPWVNLWVYHRVMVITGAKLQTLEAWIMRSPQFWGAFLLVYRHIEFWYVS